MNPGCRNHLASHRIASWKTHSQLNDDYFRNLIITLKVLNVISTVSGNISSVKLYTIFISNQIEPNRISQSINWKNMILKAFSFLLTLPLSLVDIWNPFYIQIHSIFMYLEFSSFFPFHSCSVQLTQRQSLIQVGFNRTALHAEEAIMNHIIQVKTTITKKSIKLSFGLDANGSKIEFKL